MLASWAIVLSTLLAAEVDRETIDALNRVLLRDDPRPRIEALSRLHSLRATSAFDEAAELVAGWARAAGLTVSIEEFPSDGNIRYGPFLSEPGWRVHRAELDLIEPEGRRIADGVSMPLALAWYQRPGGRERGTRRRRRRRRVTRITTERTSRAGSFSATARTARSRAKRSTSVARPES